MFLVFVTQHKSELGIVNPAMYLASVTIRYGNVKHFANAIATFLAIVRDQFSQDTLQVSAVEFAIGGCVQLARRKELRRYFFDEDMVKFIPRLLTGIVSNDAAGVIQMIYETLLLT
uniref:Serine/threonine-protein kinase KIPK n=1 Tax=Lygus hesperus TaxID=30085 RepID=A0A0A9XHW4_LYGHE